MVTVRKRTVGGRTYFYLEHAVRSGTKVSKRELYLGSEMPRDLDEVQRRFLEQVRRERWHPALDGIKAGYEREVKRMPKSAAERELEAFTVRFTYDSQRIEGSRLTLRETAELLGSGVTPRGKPVSDSLEAQAHREIFREMLALNKDLSLGEVLHWHRKLFEKTRPDIAGKIRDYQVTISGSKFVPPLPVEIGPLLREFFGWYAREKARLHPVEFAALVHLKLVTIHPFGDGNGRVSRLAMNHALARGRFPLLNIPHQGRVSYYNALERSQLKANDDIFLQWFIRRYLKEQRRYLK